MGETGICGRKRAAMCAASVIGMFLLSGVRVSAETLYTNPETGYEVILEDDADLLTAEEETALSEKMKGITEWGSAAFKSIDENEATTANYIERYYRELFGTESGTVFLIDMDNRNIWLKNNGAISRIVTDGYSDTITDNCYHSASRGDYSGCATEAFAEIEALLSGSRIAQPMKYVSNALLAGILALLLNYLLMRWMAKNRVPGKRKLLAGMQYHCTLTKPQAEHLEQTKRYSPQSSGSGGSSGSSGGGGGGSSGSGGGHSF